MTRLWTTIIEANFRRRHLNDFQRAELAYPLLQIERSWEARDIVARAAGLSSPPFSGQSKSLKRALKSLKKRLDGAK